jgi:hypothetical protein
MTLLTWLPLGLIIGGAILLVMWPRAVDDEDEPLLTDDELRAIDARVRAQFEKHGLWRER